MQEHPSRYEHEQNITRVLVVDDEETILTSVSSALSVLDENLAVGCASSAEEALEILKKVSIDLVITDLKLPNMDGLELTRSLNQHSPTTQSILMTAYGNENIFEQAKQNGCVGYLQKPFNIESLLEYINQLNRVQPNFQADLHDLNFAEILQAYTQNQKTSVLSVISAGTSGLIAVDDGTISHVQFGPLEGPSALIALLECTSGKICSLSSSYHEKKTLAVSREFLEELIAQPENPERLRMLFNHGLQRSESEIIHERPLAINPRLNGVAVDRDSKAQPVIKDFSSQDLTLAPEGTPPPQITVPTPKERREQKIKELVNEGVMHFKNHSLAEAKKSWLLALRHDEHCPQAIRNLSILEQVEKSMQPDKEEN